MDILLKIFLFHESCLQERNNFLCRNIFIYDFLKHLVIDSEKNYDGGLVHEIVLMDTVFVNQVKVSLLKGDVSVTDALSERSLYNISQLNIIVGMPLSFIAVFKSIMIAELLR